MRIFTKKFLLSFLPIFVLIAIFFSGSAQASFWDIIRALVTINPLKLEVSAPLEVEINKNFKVEAKIINKGEEKIENAKGEIYLPEELVLLRKEPVQEIGVIPGKKEKKIFWSIRGEKIGSYIISVKVSGELKGDLIEAQDSTMVEVKEFLRGAYPRKWFQDIFDFFRSWFKF